MFLVFIQASATKSNPIGWLILVWSALNNSSTKWIIASFSSQYGYQIHFRKSIWLLSTHGAEIISDFTLG